jgi:glutamate synthase (ferredoxin)
MHLTVIGEANDYLGKGMAGGEIILKVPPEANLKSHENIILGNTALYGATGGRLFAAGLAGERFAVRNSGATAIVEGVGNHGCEYMTGGTVVILGSTGFNFGAGMSGGVAYVFDDKGTLDFCLNPDMVEAGAVTDPHELVDLYQLIQTHGEKTGSDRSEYILNNWEVTQTYFKKIAPLSTQITTNVIEEADEEVEEPAVGQNGRNGVGVTKKLATGS